MKSSNITWQHGKISKESKNKLLGYKNKVLWFTGLSGSGKSTLAREVEKKLFEEGISCIVLDGDNIRHGLNKDLGFSASDRKENIRRISEVAKLSYHSGLFVLVSFISPYNDDRAFARSLIGKDFVEIYVKCSLEECEKRDPKELYKKARKNEIKEFTGVSAPYEEPKNPEIIIETDKKGIDESVKNIITFLNQTKSL